MTSASDSAQGGTADAGELPDSRGTNTQAPPAAGATNAKVRGIAFVPILSLAVATVTIIFSIGMSIGHHEKLSNLTLRDAVS